MYSIHIMHLAVHGKTDNSTNTSSSSADDSFLYFDLKFGIYFF